MKLLEKRCYAISCLKKTLLFFFFFFYCHRAICLLVNLWKLSYNSLGGIWPLPQVLQQRIGTEMVGSTRHVRTPPGITHSFNGKQWLEAEEDTSAERKTRQVYCFEKKKKERRNVEVWFKGVRRRFLLERKRKIISCRGAKTEKAQEPTVESLVRRTWRLRLLEAEQRVREYSSECYRGSRQTRKERTAVVEVWQNEWGDQFHWKDSSGQN